LFVTIICYKHKHATKQHQEPSVKKLTEPRDDNSSRTQAKAAELFNTNRTYINQAVKMKETAQKIVPSQKQTGQKIVASVSDEHATKTATKAAGAASNCNLLATSGSYQLSNPDKDMLWK
jgi:single-stranded DNA-specific DHH superfamily exonuclease